MGAKAVATLHNTRQFHYEAATVFDKPQRLRGPALISGAILLENELK